MKNKGYLCVSLFLCFAFLFCLQGKSQNFDVIVGNGTAETNVSPYNNYYKNSWTECIYLASDIAESGNIYKVAWNCSSAYAFSMYTMKIYMGTTTRTSHSNTSDWQSLSNLDLVYSGTNFQTPNTTGWQSVILDDVFEYDGTENLVVVVSKTAASYNSTPEYYYTNKSNSVLYRRNDSNLSYAEHPGSSSGTTSNNLANIRLYFMPDACPSPRSVTVTDITEESATVSWQGNANATQWQVGYGLSVDAAMQNLTTVNVTSFDMTDLDPETEYYVVVRSICGGSFSVWKNRKFKTACADTFESSNCFDLTNLNAPYITCYYGTFSNPYLNIGVMSNRHTVITTDDYDPYTENTLPVIPDCKNYSVRLGNSNTGAEAESISVNYQVDTNVSDLLLLQYAIVMEDPGHTPEDQPRFTMEILNSNNQLIDQNCGYENFIASSGLGWSSSGGVIWNEWTTVGMDLSAYHGQNVKIRLTTRDCERSGHFGYAYFTLDCGSKRMRSHFCGVDSVKTFMAPAGFRYQWFWESQPANILSTSRSYTVEGNVTDRIVCKVISMQKDGCFFYIYGSMAPRYPLAEFSANVNSCDRTCTFNNLSRVSVDGITPNAEYEPCDDALWDFGDGTQSTLYQATHQYASPGTYVVRLISGLNSFSCSDTVAYTVYMPDLSSHIDTVVCDSVRINSALYTISGDYTQHLTSVNGCDSVLTVHVVVHPSKSTEFSQVACENYTWMGNTYTESGHYQCHMQTAMGCDSLLTLHLTVGQPAETVITDTVCGSYTWNNLTYGNTGQYVQHFQTVYGCDSTVTLFLSVGHDTTCSFAATACENYTWNDVNYNTTGVYAQYFHSVLGCDSTVMLHLTVGQHETTDILDTICMGEDYRKYNFNIPQNETYSFSLYETAQNNVSQYGCDSVVNLHLTILDTTVSIVPLYGDFCENMYQELSVETSFQDYVWNTGAVSPSIVVTEPGIYSITASFKQCSVTREFVIEPCKIPVFVPNTITPGTPDGNNDYFSAYTEAMQYVEDFEINIYDRWGVLVFTSKDPGFQWDGTVNGRLLLNQLYTYKIKMTTVFKEHHFLKGTVLVI